MRWKLNKLVPDLNCVEWERNLGKGTYRVELGGWERNLGMSRNYMGWERNLGRGITAKYKLYGLREKSG